MNSSRPFSSDLDVELLEACREEFHRRLKTYHAWKSKNRKGKNPSTAGDPNDENEQERAPHDILNNGKLHLFKNIIEIYSFSCTTDTICSSES